MASTYTSVSTCWLASTVADVGVVGVHGRGVGGEVWVDERTACTLTPTEVYCTVSIYHTLFDILYGNIVTFTS